MTTPTPWSIWRGFGHCRKFRDSLSVPEALSRMRRSKSHLALVTGQDGAVVAMVALEDLVRDLVGAVRDGMQRV